MTKLKYIFEIINPKSKELIKKLYLILKKKNHTI